MVIDGLIQQVLERVRQAAVARAEAERAQNAQREESDHYVTGGVNWNGYSLEHLIKMVAEQAAPQQLDALADEWRRHGTAINQASGDLQRSLNTLMQFWSGAAADDASSIVTRNAAWINELGTTAQNMGAPIENAGGALKSAQNTMPGKPHSNWLATAGGGAAAGFAVGGPIGAAFGAAIGGIASAFGFGSNKKKLKREAVQTMQRYEGALLGIDGSTPRFGNASDGTDPGGDRLRNPGPGVGSPGTPPAPPGATGPDRNPVGPGPGAGTTPSLADPGGPIDRWRIITDPVSPGPGGIGGTGPGGRLPGGGLPGLIPPPGVGRGGLGPSGRGPLGGRGPGGVGGAGGRGGTGRGVGRGGPGGLGGRGGLGSEQERTGRGRGVNGRGGLLSPEEEEAARRRGRGAGGGRSGLLSPEEEAERRARARAGLLTPEEEEAQRRARARGGVLGAEEEEANRRGGRGGLLSPEEEAERRNGARGRFGRGGLDPHGGQGYGGMGGAGSRKEEDDEHRRRFPVEEDPFTTDLKAAPPVIGI